MFKDNKSRVLKGTASLSNFSNLIARCGSTVELALQRSRLACKYVSVCLQQTLGRFNICWAKSFTPVFLFLLSSRPEQPAFSFPPCLFPLLFLILLFFVLFTASAQKCLYWSVLGTVVPGATNHSVGIYSGTNQSSCFEADPEGCGFHPWLVILAVSSRPKWLDACRSWKFTLLYAHFETLLVLMLWLKTSFLHCWCFIYFFGLVTFCKPPNWVKKEFVKS